MNIQELIINVLNKYVEADKDDKFLIAREIEAQLIIHGVIVKN